MTENNVGLIRDWRMKGQRGGEVVLQTCLPCPCQDKLIGNWIEMVSRDPQLTLEHYDPCFGAVNRRGTRPGSGRKVWDRWEQAPNQC